MEEKRLESPEFLQTSFAAAMTMGLSAGGFYRDAKLFCANLLMTYDDGCIGNCAYCGLSKARQIQKFSDKSFIRVNWPIISLKDIISALNNDKCSHVSRVCVSMITNKRAPHDLLNIIDHLKNKTNKALSTLITPTIIDKTWMKRLKSKGCDMVGVAIDCPTKELFTKLRGDGVRSPHKWAKYWDIYKDAINVFGSRNVGIHLISGLGETEREFVMTIQKAKDIGGSTHLFSFFPEELSPLEKQTQPPLGQYRRMQLARYLIDMELFRAENFIFDKMDRIIDFGLEDRKMDKIIDNGTWLMTPGCPEKPGGKPVCNRPFGNCSPYQAYIGELRNFPFQPDAKDIRIAIEQLRDYSAKISLISMDG